MSAPLLSICIPTYNRKVKLARAIDSALSQDYDNFEVIVSDNCSTDGTEAFIKKRYHDCPRLKYYKNSSNFGMVENWRLSVDRASGLYYTILDDDNYFVYTSYLSKVASLIKENPDISLVFSDFIIRFKDRDLTQVFPLDEVSNGLSLYTKYFSKSMPQIFFTFLKRDHAIAHHFYSENIITHDVQAFLISMFLGKIGYVNRFSGIYDLTGDDNVVLTINKRWKDYIIYHKRVVETGKFLNITEKTLFLPLKRMITRTYPSFLRRVSKEEHKWMDNELRKTFSPSYISFLNAYSKIYNLAHKIIRG